MERSRFSSVQTLKGILLFFCGCGAVLGFLRYYKGLGPTTALTDLTPWGFWIGFDILGGVALAAGGFVLAGFVHVFQLKEYHAFIKPAILSAFLGYLAVIVGLLFDVGLPWQLWHVIIYWNIRSPLFEVGWCVLLYTIVLTLEFSPTIIITLRSRYLASIYNFIKKATLPLVILGIILSTLHQSSLGSLFLVMPHRLHTLWYSPILPILFFISSVSLGLMVVIGECLLTFYFYNRIPNMNRLENLGKWASWVLWFYIFIRLIDIVFRNEIGRIFENSFESWLFLFEFVIACISGTLLSIHKARRNLKVIGVSVGLGIFGIILNRINVGGLAMIGTTGTRYVPSWMEIVLSFGIISTFILLYLFALEHLSLYDSSEICDDWLQSASPPKEVREQSTQQYSLGFVKSLFIFLFGIAFMSIVALEKTWSEVLPSPDPVISAGYSEKMIIDGNRKGFAVVFDHLSHIENNGQEKGCPLCHHMNRPHAKASACSECHRDMEISTSIFDHTYHARLLRTKSECLSCHCDNHKGQVKPCLECHQGMIAQGAQIIPKKPPNIGSAPSYRAAMHGVCIPCHQDNSSEDVRGLCEICHPSSRIYKMDDLKPGQRGRF